jgi:hypothetical protein
MERENMELMLYPPEERERERCSSIAKMAINCTEFSLFFIGSQLFE